MKNSAGVSPIINGRKGTNSGALGTERVGKGGKARRSRRRKGLNVGSNERLVKSLDRVRDLGEVFTPAATVESMLDLLPEQAWEVHPSRNFLEPSCGDGNFLVAILQRKLERVVRTAEAGQMPAGKGPEAFAFHGLAALASIYAVDISSENVVGGVPGHEIGARTRLLSQFEGWTEQVFGLEEARGRLLLESARWVVRHNVLVGNMLGQDAAGQKTNRDALPLVEYEFDPSDRAVILRRTSLGAVLESLRAEATPEPSLFGPPDPEVFWTGPSLELFEADYIEAPNLLGPARNGVAR